jgi:hypothetical protein
MNTIQDIKHWLEEGNLYRAEKAIQECSDDLGPEAKKELEELVNEISIRHYRILAGKAVISQDESLLDICIKKLSNLNAPVEGLKNSLHQIRSKRRSSLIQKIIVLVLGIASLASLALFVLA